MRLPIILAAALTFASAAEAKPIVLRPGESVTVTVDDGGRTVEMRREPASSLTPFETEWVRQMTNGELDWAIGPKVAISTTGDKRFPAPGPIEPAVAVVKLVPIGEKYMLLVITNGFSRGFKYRAKQRREERAVATDVCEVMAEKRGIEYWPYLFEAIEISDVELVPWQDGQAPVCE
jgi:hypothetical protein